MRLKLTARHMHTFIARFLFLGIGYIAMTGQGFAQSTPGEFYLIAGSFHSFDKANEALEELEDQGFKPIILFPDGDQKDLYRVSIYQAKKRTEVVQYQALLKGQGRKAGWIYEGKAPTATAATATSSRAWVQPIPDGAKEVHYLIVASLKGYPEALETAAELNGKGYETEILFPGSGSDHYRISVYRAVDREEIDAYASMLKRQGKESGWIHTESLGTAGAMASRSVPVPASSVTRSAGAAKGLRFHLIVGSYENYMVALDYSEQLKEKGYDALVIFPDKPTGSYRVSIYHSDSRTEVAGFGQNQKRQGKPTGWVFDRGQ